MFVLYETYVKGIKSTSKKDLIVIPLIIGLLTFLAPTVLQLVLSLIFLAPLDQVGSFPGMLGMAITVFLFSYIMKRVSKYSYGDLGLQKDKWFLKSVEGAIGGIVILGMVVLLIWMLGGTKLVSNASGVQFGPFLVGLLFFIFQGTWEELIYRG